MKEYDHKKIEKKWKKNWEKAGIYETKENLDKPKYYVLDMFPYPSGSGLHVGHPKGYIATDIVARMKMMQGFNVLHPMGWDAFGLPAENYAIKNKVHPSVAVEKNIATFKKQLGLLGFTYDWNREVNTTDPAYYKWTQWAFIQMFKKGLAFESNEPINWCPSCQTGLANEDLDDGKCERCGSVVERKPMRQWVLKITDYADRLLNDLKKLPAWPEPIKLMQKEWIGRSEGATVRFTVILSGAKNPSHGERDSSITPQNDNVVKVFTTRPDTIFGATYLVIAPEHELVKNLESRIYNLEEIKKYVAGVKNKSDLERTELNKEKTGVELKGIKAINPANGEEIPVFIADYVLTGYGTGAIMAVPAHDERDFAFAKKYGLSIKQVVAPHFQDPANLPREGKPSVRRKTIHVIIQHPKEKKILMLNWFTNLTPNRTHLHTLVLGGIENGEDLFVAAIREAREETGYQNFEFVRQLDLDLHTEYYAEHKEVNRYAEIKVVVLKLADNERKEISAAELKNHEPVWIDEDKVPEIMNVVDGKIIWDTYINGYTPFANDGEAVNSGFLNGLSTSAAKEKIIAWLEEKGIGQKKVQYKLRDWVFSRQRYWGEPIPLVHCDVCAKRKKKVVIIHGFGGNGSENWFSWLKSELTRDNYEVFAPDLPDPETPDLRFWVDALKKLPLEAQDEIIIVAHSLGGPTACKFISELKLPIAKLILVAPVWKSGSFEHLKQHDFSADDIELMKKFGAEGILIPEIKEFIKDTTLILSEDDPFIPLRAQDDYSELSPKVRMFKDKSHFSEHHGNLTVFPEILSEFKNGELVNPGWFTIPENELPLQLPKVKSYEPSGTGESPLVNIAKWVNTKCPHCGGPAKRETNTMPQWAGSCWYYLRYIDPKNNKALVDNQKEKYWSPIDLYVGGAEHATRHLIYARFWHKFLYDIGAVNYEEPFTRLQNVGLILAEDGRKMGKRYNNAINPDDVVAEFGADAMRLYEMFMGPFDQSCTWSTKGVVGMKRFLEKVWALQQKVVNKQTVIQSEAKDPSHNKLTTVLHQTIKKVTEDIESMHFNTAISQLMILVNKMVEEEALSVNHYSLFLQLLAPFAPHITEELWEVIGQKNSITTESWPKFDSNLIQFSEFTLAVQINGKLRDTIVVPSDIDEAKAKETALGSEKVQKWLEGKEPKKVIYVKGKLVSIVI